jgi:hypothetical protein
MFSAKSLIPVLAFASIGFTQINLLSDQITFRATTNDEQRTTHYGNMDLYGDGTGIVLNVRSQVGGSRTAVYGLVDQSGGLGTGGYFLGGMYGVRGRAMTTGGSGTRCGGYFEAGNGSTNWGVYASVLGSGNYAGYFNGVVYSTGGYQQPSDARFKTDMQPLQGALQKVMALKPQTYFYDTLSNPKMNFPSRRQFGLIAQEAELVFPEIVGEATVPDTAANQEAIEKFKTINYTALVPVLIAAIQEQQKEIDDLKRALGK